MPPMPEPEPEPMPEPPMPEPITTYSDIWFAGLSENSDCNLYSEVDPPQRNAHHWAAALDFSCVSYTHRMTAISPTVCLGAAHCGYAVGDTVTFVGSDNSVITRTIASKETIGHDLCRIVLSSALPASVTPALVGAYSDLTPGAGQERLVLWCGQFRTVNTLSVQYTLGDRPNGIGAVVTGDAPIYRPDLYRPLAGGDSGSPWFVVVDAGGPKLQLIGTTYTTVAANTVNSERL